MLIEASMPLHQHRQKALEMCITEVAVAKFQWDQVDVLHQVKTR